MEMNKYKLPKGVILNLYPDSLGSCLHDLVTLLSGKQFKDAFSIVYLLPTFFHSDLDRGFSIIDYDLNEELVKELDLDQLKRNEVGLKLDIVLNHLSVASPQFSDLLEKGEKSVYKDFFINWNAFWQGHGEMGEDGILIPRQKYLDKLFMRKPGLPVLQVPFPDGSIQPYWNTFYQEIRTIENDSQNGEQVFLGQMDVNARSEAVWNFYDETLDKLRDYGSKIVRLDAFAYLHKEVGEVNFFNKPGTWEYLDRLRKMADEKGLLLLPEIHAEYGSGLHREISDRGYMIYDFFMPGLLLHTLEHRDKTALVRWGQEIVENEYRTVNMLGCHDGIPVLDLKGKEVDGIYRKGLLTDSQIDQLIDQVLERGGKVKNIFDPSGNKISYYQVNATFFSALGEDPRKLLLARAIQLFMPGTPQIWYLDLFAGKNDYEAVERFGAGGHKEINRTDLSLDQIESLIDLDVVQLQLEMIKLRNTCTAFDGKVVFEESLNDEIRISWANEHESASLFVNLNSLELVIKHLSENGEYLLEL